MPPQRERIAATDGENMKRLLYILLLLLIFWAPVYTQAQSTNATTAGALGNSSSVCTNSSGLLTTSGCPSSGAATSEPFVTIGNTSGLSAERALVGTSNQITVTDGGANGNITLSLPQSINTGAAVSFGSVALAGTAGAGFEEYPAQSSAPSAPSSGFREYADSTGRKSWIRASDGFTRTWDATLTGNRFYTLPDANSTFPVASQVLTFSGPTAARTITLPDASFTAARTDAGQTFTGTQVFTSPKVITSVLDTNGNTLLGVTATGSAVNYLTLANAATTGSPTLSATGSDSNIGIVLTPKGTGSVSTGGQFVDSLNGAASTPPVTLTGTWFTGGSATTTKPQLLVEPTGTTSTGWSTSGTGLGLNAASGFVGNLADFQVAGASQAVIYKDGSFGGYRVDANTFELYISTATALARAQLQAVNGRLIQFGSNVGGGILGFAMASDTKVVWTSIASGAGNDGGNGGSADTGFARNAAGIVEINNGAGGTFRDLKLRNLIPGASLSTGMTDGFVNIPGAAGSPSGTPNNTTGFPMYFDSTNLKICVYTGGAWKCTGALS